MFTGFSLVKNYGVIFVLTLDPEPHSSALLKYHGATFRGYYCYNKHKVGL